MYSNRRLLYKTADGLNIQVVSGWEPIEFDIDFQVFHHEDQHMGGTWPGANWSDDVPSLRSRRIPTQHNLGKLFLGKRFGDIVVHASLQATLTIAGNRVRS